MKREIDGDEDVVEMIPIVMELTVMVNKMLVPVAIGGVIVVLPYVLAISYLADAASSWGGKGVAAVVLAVVLLTTMVPLTLLMMGAVMKVNEWLPWDAFDL